LGKAAPERLKQSAVDTWNRLPSSVVEASSVDVSRDWMSGPQMWIIKASASYTQQLQVICG